MYGYIDELVRGARGIDRLEQHRAFVLVEEFGRLVDVVVGSCIGAAEDHYGQAGGLRRRGMIHAVVVNGWLKEVFVLLDPARVGCQLAV